MKKILLFQLCMLLFLYSKAQASDIGDIDKIVQEATSSFIQGKTHTALSIGIIYKGKTHTYHCGTTEKGESSAPNDGTIYEIGSITKTITGTLLARAVVDKKVNFEDDVRKYLNEAYPNLEYNGQPIRLFHLLNHSSGLPFMLPDVSELFEEPDYDTLPFILSSIERNYSKQQFFEDLKKVKLDTVPGIKLSYSNSAAQLLGYILERVYRMPYEDLVAKYISGPLKMPRTMLTFSGEEEKHLAKGYNGKGKLMPYTLSGAAGGLYSTVPDLLNYARYHFNEDDSVVALTHEPTWGNIQYYAMGLNWQMEDRADGHRKIFQSGGTPGFSSFLVIYPELDISIVLLSNESAPDTQGELSKIAQKVFDQLMED